MNTNILIGLIIALLFTLCLAVIANRNRRAAQTRILGKPVTFREGIKLTMENIKKSITGFFKTMNPFK